jgi:hypothetical protein
MIKPGLDESVREGPSISADLVMASQIFLLVTSSTLGLNIFMNILHTMADLMRKYQPSSSGIGRETHEI